MLIHGETILPWYLLDVGSRVQAKADCWTQASSLSEPATSESHAHHIWHHTLECRPCGILDLGLNFAGDLWGLSEYLSPVFTLFVSVSHDASHPVYVVG